MLKEEHKAILDSLLNADSQADRSELLNKLDADYSAILAERDTALTERDTLKADNEKFARINNDLFLRVGVSERVENGNGEEGDNNTPPAKMSYDDLKF